MQIQMCKNVKCINVVPPSRNSGVPRLYCSIRCRRAQGARDSYNREHANPGVGGLRVLNGHPYVERTISSTAAAAFTRLKKHIDTCVLNDNQRCRAYNDVYANKKLCIIHAVLAEDWHQLRRAEKGSHYDRIRTTDNGFWIEDSALADSVRRAQEAADATRRERVEYMYDIGAGVRPTPRTDDESEFTL